jgi:hypothetical protein
LKTYTLYIHDRRYSVPTFMAADFPHEDQVREYAATRLLGSQFYTGIEIWDGDLKVFEVRPSDVSAQRSSSG